MKLINSLLALTFLFNITFYQTAFAENSAPTPIQKVLFLKNFKNLETFLQFMKTKYSREEISFLRNRLILGGFDLNRPMDLKVNGKEQSIFIPKIGKTLRFTETDALAMDGLIFNLDNSRPLDQNIKNFEKLLTQKGFGKIEFGFSTAEADDEATLKMVAGAAAAVATLYLLTKLGHPYGLILGLALVLAGWAGYLYFENKPPALLEKEGPQLSAAEFVKALDLLSKIRCAPDKIVLGKQAFKDYTVQLRDGSYILVKVDDGGTGGLMTKYSKEGRVEMPIRLPEELRKIVGSSLKSYCATKPDESSLDATLKKLKSALSQVPDSSKSSASAVTR